MKAWPKILPLLVLTAGFLVVPKCVAVDFPGPLPGKAESSIKDGVLTLGNSDLSVSWKLDGETIHPLEVFNKLTGKRYDQSGAELFRLGLKPAPVQKGVVVGIRLEEKRVVALGSKDGVNWTELDSYPRSEFQGEPKVVRLGKMNLKAETRSHAGEAGAMGESFFTEFSLAKSGGMDADYIFNTNANRTATREYAFPSGTKLVSCRIDRGTDQGMSWAPALALVWEEGKKFLLIGLRENGPVFNVTTAAGEQMLGRKVDELPALDVLSSGFKLEGAPIMLEIKALPKGVRRAEKSAGVGFEADMISAGGIRAHWHAELRDESSYVRQQVDFSTVDKSTPLFAMQLLDIREPNLETIGKVPGCPVAGNGMFFGVEMPGAQNKVEEAGAQIGLACQLTLSKDQSYSFGTVQGVVPEGQLRRGFLYYVERERARPSSPFLHYNCWYDLGFSADAAKIIDVVNHFNQEMMVKRGVEVRSYLVDDGWDDPSQGMWSEDTSKYPGGFAALSKKLADKNAHLSIWISPLGGYGYQPERRDDARKKGIIPKDADLDLAYPGYKKWFEERCLQLMREDGVNGFKWDKAGDGVSPHFMALLDVARHLRNENPSVFINVTVGTWPSPFWLKHVDSTWRNGSGDVGWAGKGDDREQWLTFRDGYCRALFVQNSPLYPLNSIMAHGIVHGRYFQGERVSKAGKDLKNEARSYFAIGSSLQELYLTPSMMTPKAWDDVADAARWARENADVLADSHWVGGDPLKLQVYGYASWSKRKGELMIRNPDDKEQVVDLDAAVVFELPGGASKKYLLRAPYQDQRVQSLEMEAGVSVRLSLKPFEVLVWDAYPQTP